jgi:hypothetical protein
MCILSIVKDLAKRPDQMFDPVTTQCVRRGRVNFSMFADYSGL